MAFEGHLFIRAIWTFWVFVTAPGAGEALAGALEVGGVVAGGGVPRPRHLGALVLVRAVLAVLLAVAAPLAGDALAVAALELVLGAAGQLAAPLVAAVAAVVVEVALPVLGHALGGVYLYDVRIGRRRGGCTKIFMFSTTVTRCYNQI